MSRQSSRSSRHGSGVPDMFVSLAKEKERVQQIQAELKAMVQEIYPDQERFIEAIEALGLPILMNGPEWQLKFSLLLMGTEPGFIPPTLPKYAEFIQSLKKNFPEKAHMDFSKGVLVTLKDLNHFSFLCYQFYHWMMWHKGFGGYSHEARRLFHIFNRKYNSTLHPKFLEKLDYEETCQLKMAIRREKEALQFVRHLMHEVFIPKNNGKLLDSGKAQA